MTFLNLFLQITTTAADSTGATSNAPSISLLDLIMKGGWVMVPIAVLSLLSVYIMIERYITIKRASKDTTAFMEKVKSLIIQGDVKGAKALCQQTDSPIARMMEKGVSRLGRPLKDIESSIEAVGKLEVYKLEKNISVLGIIAGVAPMLGFVGTISGVIRIFYNISIEENISIGGIAEGLYEKMITSASGLIVGIVAHIGFHYLNLLIDRVVYKMESNAIEFTDLLQENK
ncbi:MAG TPA: MotA/TolQ/ExbB proton channel family protein [Cytophagaceae bacterium]|jgi:biopolymer transport protein ExbB|nr:MotA/TolQ/ExbB proton channel family protein [Cytophagaceae bacterium]